MQFQLLLVLLFTSTVVFAYPQRVQPQQFEEDDDDEKMMKDGPSMNEKEGPYVDFRDECTPRLDVGGCKCTNKDESGNESVVEYDDDDDCRNS